MSEFRVMIGEESFAYLRKNNYYYVDKTGFLNDFLPLSARVSLITRPRRFGKTLFMSMLTEFFDIDRKSRDLFAGLKVSANKELCAQWMNQYPVVFFSLKDVDGDSFSDALNELQRVFSSVVMEHDSLLTSNAVDTADREVLTRIKHNRATVSELRSFLMILTRAMRYQHCKPAIVLLDEYDVPVAKAEANGYYDEMIDFMRGFLSSALKTNSSNLLFAVLTGCLRITRESIFSGLNNLKCYDISDCDYADTFGFTQEEVDRLLAEAGLSSKREEVREWYDGYRFGDNQEIYCPWSIMNYVADHRTAQPAPKAYWLHSSDNALVRRLVANSTTDLTPSIDILLEGGTLLTKINHTPGYKNLASTPANIWSLLYLTGYLTKVPQDANYALPGTDALTIPNKEIREIFCEDLREWFSHRLQSPQRSELHEAFWKPDADRFAKLLSDILLVSISVFDYREHFYHGVLTGIFLSTNTYTISNLETGEGRSDILVWEGDKAAVIEVKRARNEEELPALLDMGIRQIADNHYDARFRANPAIHTIFHWSMAFCRKSVLARVVLAVQR